MKSPRERGAGRGEERQRHRSNIRVRLGNAGQDGDSSAIQKATTELSPSCPALAMRLAIFERVAASCDHGAFSAHDEVSQSSVQLPSIRFNQLRVPNIPFKPASDIVPLTCDKVPNIAKIGFQCYIGRVAGENS